METTVLSIRGQHSGTSVQAGNTLTTQIWVDISLMWWTMPPNRLLFGHWLSQLMRLAWQLSSEKRTVKTWKNRFMSMFTVIRLGMKMTKWFEMGLILQIDGLVQERRNSIANALELRLSCTKPSKWYSLINYTSSVTWGSLELAGYIALRDKGQIIEISTSL